MHSGTLARTDTRIRERLPVLRDRVLTKTEITAPRASMTVKTTPILVTGDGKARHVDGKVRAQSPDSGLQGKVDEDQAQEDRKTRLVGKQAAPRDARIRTRPSFHLAGGKEQEKGQGHGRGGKRQHGRRVEAPHGDEKAPSPPARRRTRGCPRR